MSRIRGHAMAATQKRGMVDSFAVHMSKRPTVAVCVATYRRPHGLERLLYGLDALMFTEGREPDLRLIVVDNDPEGTGARVCEDVGFRIRWPLLVEIEPRRGIPFARNRALALAADAAEFIAFIDDDEEPDPRWLDELLRVQAEFQADVVTGPVIPRFSEPPPAWLQEGRFFERRRIPTGTRVEYVATGNVLFRAKLPKEANIRFNEAMALTGGSDTYFFLQMARAGASMVFANDAIVYEWVPPSRANAAWLLRRSFRFGNTLAIIDRELSGTLKAIFLRAAKGIGRIVLGLSSLPLAIISGRHAKAAAIKALQGVWRGAGMLAGLSGFRYEEYRQIHGE